MPFQEIEVIPQFLHSVNAAGAVDHDDTDADQEKNDRSDRNAYAAHDLSFTLPAAVNRP